MDVIVVEDEPAIADTVLYALESEGIRCHWSSTGADALNTLATQTPRLVLLDIGLPDMNGFDAFRAIRLVSSVPIIFLTSRDSEVDQVLGMELGADDYITKPFSPRVLSARVRMHLRRADDGMRTPNPTPSLFEVDTAARRIQVSGVVLGLSRYEYGLLALLIAHPNRVYSREQLMEQVWAAPDHSLDRTVDTHIKMLRKKIREVNAELDPIKTHRGIGYSFEWVSR